MRPILVELSGRSILLYTLGSIALRTSMACVVLTEVTSLLRLLSELFVKLVLQVTALVLLIVRPAGYPAYSLIGATADGVCRVRGKDSSSRPGIETKHATACREVKCRERACAVANVDRSIVAS